MYIVSALKVCGPCVRVESFLLSFCALNFMFIFGFLQFFLCSYLAAIFKAFLGNARANTDTVVSKSKRHIILLFCFKNIEIAYAVLPNALKIKISSTHDEQEIGLYKYDRQTDLYPYTIRKEVHKEFFRIDAVAQF